MSDEKDRDADAFDEFEEDSAGTAGNVAPEPPEPAPATAKRTGSSSSLPLIAVVVLAAAGLFWYLSVQRPAMESVDARLAGIEAGQTELQDTVGEAARAAAAIKPELAQRFESAVQPVRGEVEAVQGEVQAVRQAQSGLQGQIDKAAKTAEELKRSVSALYAKEQKTTLDWILSEVEYMVLAANQRLALERDVATALAALKAADERLRSAEHPDLIPVREQVIADINALEGVKQPDIEGIALYFADALKQVDDLPTRPINNPDVPFDSVRDADYQEGGFTKVVSDMWSDLIRLVEVKDAAMPDDVLFDPELRYFLQQNLRLELSSGRMAVLRRDSRNLKASTELASKMLETYYDTADPRVSGMIDKLSKLKDTELKPKLPSVSGSLNSIRSHRSARAAARGSGGAS